MGLPLIPAKMPVRFSCSPDTRIKIRFCLGPQFSSHAQDFEVEVLDLGALKDGPTVALLAGLQLLQGIESRSLSRQDRSEYRALAPTFKAIEARRFLKRDRGVSRDGSNLSLIHSKMESCCPVSPPPGSLVHGTLSDSSPAGVWTEFRAERDVEDLSVPNVIITHIFCGRSDRRTCCI